MDATPVAYSHYHFSLANGKIIVMVILFHLWIHSRNAFIITYNYILVHAYQWIDSLFSTKIYVYDIVHHLRFVGSGRSALWGAFSKQLRNSINCDLQQIIYYEQNLNNTSKLPHKQ